MSSQRKKCVISHCGATMNDFPDRKFFDFPKKGTARYNEWLALAEESRNKIEHLKRPLICSKHFKNSCIGKKYLKQSAYPSLFLKQSEDISNGNDGTICPSKVLLKCEKRNETTLNSSTDTDEQYDSGSQQSIHKKHYETRSRHVLPRENSVKLECVNLDETLSKEFIPQENVKEITEIKQEQPQDEWSIFECSETKFIEQTIYPSCANLGSGERASRDERLQDNSCDNEYLKSHKRGKGQTDEGTIIVSSTTKCDEHFVYGEYIAERFRTCNKAKSHIAKAKQLIEHILNDLCAGDLITEKEYTEPFATDAVIKMEPDV